MDPHESSAAASLPALPPACRGDAPVTVFLRPGCPFCAVLMLGLARTGLDVHRVDIWQQPEGAAWVRAVADGNETVPTVHVAATGGTGEAASVALINPSIDELVAVVTRLAPQALPVGGPPSWSARLRLLLGRPSKGQR
jgi:mycoredoxin